MWMTTALFRTSSAAAVTSSAPPPTAPAAETGERHQLQDDNDEDYLGYLVVECTLCQQPAPSGVGPGSGGGSDQRHGSSVTTVRYL